MMDPMMSGMGPPPGMGMGPPGMGPPGMGMPPMDMGMGGPPPGGGGAWGNGGLDANGKPYRVGYAGWAVWWPIGRKTHTFVIYLTLGAAALGQSGVVLCVPFIKQLYFVSGELLSVAKVPGTASTWTTVYPGFRGPGLLQQHPSIASLRVGWLGSCLYDRGSAIHTCDLVPSYPLAVSDFSLAEAKGIASILGQDTGRALVANAGAALLTVLAIFSHRLLRLRGPYYVSAAACVISFVAFFVDCGIFLGLADKISKVTPGLIGNMGPAIGIQGVAAAGTFIGAWASYSRGVKSEMGWPKRDPNKPAKAAGGGAPPPMGMPPMDPMMGGPPMGGMPPMMPPGPPGM